LSAVAFWVRIEYYSVMETQTQQSGTQTPQQLVSLMSGKGIAIGVLVIALLWIATTYNTLVTKNQSVDTQWAQVETQYQRRIDLIPNLVSSVQGAMKQEKEVFTTLAEARSRYAGAATTGEKIAAANQVESSFGRLLAVMENYPQLRSIEAVNTLMVSLEGTENRVSVERNRFNEVVGEYQLATKRFPGGMLAALFGFGPRELFKAAEGAQNAPKVQF
jgi:LemA protein